MQALPETHPRSARSAWRPVLEGRRAEEAADAVRAVVGDLQRFTDAGEFVGMPELSVGSGGLALLAAYAGDVAPAAGRTLEVHLDQMADGVAAQPVWADLFRGFTGAGWVAEHLAPLAGGQAEPVGEDPAEAVDRGLENLLAIGRWRDSFDLIIGLAGFGVYALERLPRPSARRCLERIVDHLEATVERSARGCTWYTPTAWLPPHQREACPHGHYNLGLAHGVPGLIAFLGAVAAAGVARHRVEPLLAGAVDWVLAHELPPASPGRFPFWIGTGIAPRPARLAWCYGDPGVAAALWIAGCAASEPSWRDHAVRIARHAAARTFESSQVNAPGLCHGAAGVAHVFHRLYQQTGDDALGDAARAWFGRTLDMREPGRGVGGFRLHHFDPEAKRWVWKSPRGFLTGAAGVALALTAAVVPVEPAWDRVLLLSHRFGVSGGGAAA